MSPWKPGSIVRVSVPMEHVVGHEQADNPEGPRPWVIVYVRGVKHSEMLIGVPMTRQAKAPPDTHMHLAYDQNDVDISGCPSPISGDGVILLDQVRAISTKRVAMPPCGRLKPELIARVRSELAAMMQGLVS